MKRLKTLTLIAILVVSIVGTPAMAASDTSGMVGVPDSNVMEDLPADSDVEISAADLEGSVMASSNAEGMELILTTPERAADYVNGSQIRGDDLALVFRDNSSHEGRTVAVPSDAIRAVYGYLPEAVHGVHDSGEEWVRPTSGESGLLIFEVPKFSSNVVTFTGEATISSSGATNGSTVSWELSDLDATSDPVINLTGEENTEWDNVSVSGVSDGTEVSLDLAGTDVTGVGGDPEVTFTGISSQNSRTEPADGSSFTVGGNLAPTDEQISVSTSRASASSGGPTVGPSETKSFSVDASSIDTVTRVEVDVTHADSGDGKDFEVYWDFDGGSSQKYFDDSGGQTKTFTWTGSVSGGVLDLRGQNYYSQYYDFYVDSVTAYGEKTGDVSVSVGGSSYTFQSDGTKDINLSSGVSYSPSYSKQNSGGSVNADINFQENTVSEDPGIDIDQDGTAEASHTGTLSHGETATVALSTLSPGDGLVDVKTSGTVDADFALKEVTETTSPGVEFNNESSVSYSGTLADGETVQRTVNKSVLQEGTNQVEVSLPELSADAPAPQVAFGITHDAASDISADYASNGWREEYNVSTTYSTTKTGASLEVPFSSPVYKIPYLEESVDGDSWTAIPDDRYSLDGSTLTVQLDDGDSDGDVDGGTEYAVRVAGDKMDVRNGAVTITDPVEPGDSQLDVGVRIDSKQPGFEIGVGGTKNGHLIHYPYQESWSNPTGQAIVESGGAQSLEFPNAPEGGSTRITTVPLEINPESGDASISIQDPDEPIFKVGPGGSTGDDLEIRYHDTTSGKTYELYSTSRSRTVGTDTAESPAIFEEDDSEETFEIRLQEETAGTDEIGVGTWPEPTPDSSIARYGIVAGWLGLLVALAYGTGKASMRARTRWFVLGTTTIGGGLLTLELLNPGSISERLGRVIESSLADLLPLAGLAAIGIVVYSIYSWWKKRQAEASTPETSVAFNLRGSKNK